MVNQLLTFLQPHNSKCKSLPDSSEKEDNNSWYICQYNGQVYLLKIRQCGRHNLD